MQCVSTGACSLRLESTNTILASIIIISRIMSEHKATAVALTQMCIIYKMRIAAVGASRTKRTTVREGKGAASEREREKCTCCRGCRRQLRPPSLISRGARKCNFHDSQKGRRRAQYLQRSVDCLSWSSTHINALSLSPASSFFFQRRVLALGNADTCMCRL